MAGARRGPRAEDRPAAPDLHRHPLARLPVDSAAIVPFTVTIRSSSSVSRERFDTLDEALVHLEGTLRPVAAITARPTARFMSREYQPSAQVAARGELSGRGLRCGVDIHGDGSLTAFSGRWRRRPIPTEGHEDAFQALRRAVS